MSLIKIKQLDERVATSGLFMGDPAIKGGFRRKLEPGEIVEVPDDMTVGPEKDNLMEMLWRTGKIDMVPPSMMPTRPLDYRNKRHAQLCSPTFKPRDPTDERDMVEIRAKYQRELDEHYSEHPGEPDVAEKKHPTKAPPPDRRARRRARAEAADGEAATT